VQRIVVAANAEAEQPWVADAAAQLARDTGAEVAVVSVDELETEKLSPLPREVYRERAEQAATRAVERLEAQGVRASRSVRSGRALEEIIAFADEQDADVIVAGSSTRGPVASALLGSVPMGLVSRAGRPVLVVTEPGRSHPSGRE
jgi:nucleotide-binding universal stress UspA family protein